MLSDEQIRTLADLYDKANSPIDPYDKESRKAVDDFNEALSDIHARKAPEIQWRDFKREAIRQLKLFLQKNDPPDPRQGKL